jgi:hypothetical protein
MPDVTISQLRPLFMSLSLGSRRNQREQQTRHA